MIISIENIVSIASGLGALSSVVYLGLVKIARLEVKVDTMWDFQIRRAFSETIERQLGRSNSPLTFEPHVIALLDPMRSDLQDWWKSVGKTLNERMALIDIENKFGAHLVHRVCVPNNLTHGSCLLLALAVAQQSCSLDLKILGAPPNQKKKEMKS